ncbi:MAG TPA: hypothetical protein PKE19_01430 [Aestuariivirga sp.]|nr:hypothetical protein [Aestuariivirga sp.]
MRSTVLSLWFSVVLSATSLAATPADILRQHLEAGTLAQGITALAPAAEGHDKEALAARGVLKFMTGMERFAQAMHRHGLESGGNMMVLRLPLLRLPVPPNPHPEKLDYQGLRQIFSSFVADMAAAEADLAALGDQPVSFPLDLARLHLDINGDGTITDAEGLGRMLTGLGPAGAPAPDMAVHFDTTDIYWLRGYGNFLAAFAQFLLAHDFSATFDKSFQLFFPRAGLPLGDEAAPVDDLLAAGERVDRVADAIALIHLVNWQVVEPERRREVRLHLKAMADLSRKSWTAARAETDDDHEWLPNARQHPAFAFGPVDDTVIDGWLQIMTEMEQVLDGRKLLPHWRFAQGMNLQKFLDDGKSFDLVLLLAGQDARPWLESGPVSDTATWNNLTQAFRGNFLSYALWFN